MEYSLIEWAANVGGIGGVLALVMFFVYRNAIRQNREDRKFLEDRSREDRKQMEDRMAGVTSAYNDTVRENSTVLRETITYLKSKNGGK